MTARRGAALLDVIAALLLLEILALGALGTLVLGARLTGLADRTERAVALAEGVLDSLAGVDAPTSGSLEAGTDTATWAVESDGATVLRVRGHRLVEPLVFETWFGR